MRGQHESPGKPPPRQPNMLLGRVGQDCESEICFPVSIHQQGWEKLETCNYVQMGLESS